MADAHEHPDFQREKSTPRPPEKTDPSRPFPYLVVALLAIVLLLVLWSNLFPGKQMQVKYSFFLKQLEAGNVKSVVIKGTSVEGKWKEVPENPDLEKNPQAPALAESFSTEASLSDAALKDLLDRLEAQGTEVAFIDPNPGWMVQMLMYLFFPLLLLVIVFIMLRRNSDPLGPGMFGSFIRSPAKRFRSDEHRTTFDDVAGMESAKGELREIVEFLRDPAKFQRLGAQIPKGVLLNGPPGTGKTLLARAVAGEAEVPFFSINGSEFIQMFVGVGASRVRDMFKTAKDNSPCILFIDEIDAVGRIRGAGLGGGHDEREQTLNQILSEMDGFQQTEAVIVLAATNRPDVLDPALLRPGRFDRHVTVDKPNREGRLGILKVHVRKVPLAENVDLGAIASSTIGFAGADLKNLVNEAALNAAREGKSAVENSDFEAARDKIIMGVPREEVLNEYERRMTAYHEAGHALLAWLLPEVDPVHKVTIVPRGRALGVTQLLPEEERFHYGEKRLKAMLAMMLGGRAAEKIVFDEYSAGAEDDLKRASAIARRMVGYWGMSEKIGPVAFRDGEEHPFLGKEIHEHRQYSEETAHLIDTEMQSLLTNAHHESTRILNEHRNQLDTLADALLEKENIDHSDIAELIGPPRERTYASRRSEDQVKPS